MTNTQQGSEKMKIYIASKTKHADKWIALRAAGINIISTWIDEAGAGQSPDMVDLRDRCIKESLECDAMVVYSEEGDYLKGAFIEMGVALSQPGKPIVLVGPVLPAGSAFTHGQNILTSNSVETAIKFLESMGNPAKSSGKFDEKKPEQWMIEKAEKEFPDRKRPGTIGTYSNTNWQAKLRKAYIAGLMEAQPLAAPSSEGFTKDQIQLAISKAENYYDTPYARTSDGKDSLHIKMLDTSKAADSVLSLLNSQPAPNTGGVWVKALADIRNKLYEQLPTGEVKTFDLVQVIKWHINDLDNLCSMMSPLDESQSPADSQGKEAKEIERLKGLLKDAVYAGWYNGLVEATKHEYAWEQFKKTHNL